MALLHREAHQYLTSLQLQVDGSTLGLDYYIRYSPFDYSGNNDPTHSEQLMATYLHPGTSLDYS
jgi:hypothetical protein